MRDFSDAGKDPELLKQKKKAARAERAERRRKEAEEYEAEAPKPRPEAKEEPAVAEISIEDAIAGAVAEAAEKESRRDRRRRRKADPRRRRTRRIVGFSVLAVLVCAIGVAAWWLWPRAPHNIDIPPAQDSGSDLPNSFVPDSIKDQISGNAQQKEGVFTFLLGGTDEDGTRTDVLMTVTLDTVNGSIKMLSIPRDSMVRANTSTGVRKINSAFGTKRGIEATKEAVARITGYYVNRYVIVDLDGFVELIDAVGGVWYDVPRDMYYKDPTQDLYIDLKKGYQLLDGEKAIQLVRFRKGYLNQDLGRIETTQGFLKALFETLVQPKNIMKFQSYAKLLTEDTETDLTISELVWLATQAAKIDPEKIESFTAPGSSRMVYGASYIVLKEEPLLEIINTHMNPLKTPILDVDVVTGGILTPTPAAPTPVVPDTTIPTATPEATPETTPEVTPETQE